MPKIKMKELDDIAHSFGYHIQHECGGYRIVDYNGGGNIFPSDGISPVTTRQKCHIFLLGMLQEQKRNDRR